MWIGTYELTWKRIFLVLGILLGIALFVWFVWWLLAPETPEGTQPVVQPPSVGGLPEPGERRPPLPPRDPRIPEQPPIGGVQNQPDPTARGGMTIAEQLTREPVSYLTLSGDGRTPVVYKPNEGKFYHITRDGREEALTNRVFRDVERATWAPSAEKAVLEFPDGANIMMDFKTNTQVTLPKEWEAFSFAPSGSALAFKSLGVRDEDRWLAVAAPDGSEATRIEHLGFNDHKVIVDWSPSNQVVALYPEAQSGNSQDVLLIGRNQENFLALPVEGRGFRSKWSPDGANLLYSVYQIGGDASPELFIASATGDTVGNMNVSLGLKTWPEKCTFANTTTVFCAVPAYLPPGAGLMPSVAKDIPDRIMRLDLASGTTSLVAEPTSGATVGQMVVSEDGRTLYYTNTRSGVLERIQLKE